MTLLRISVALATCNGARFLSEQLADLAAQKRLPSELVVFDDVSDDDTVAVVQAFAAGAPFPVKLHRNSERVGYRLNFMRAAAACTGDLIAFCDQDDRWSPDKLSRLADCFDTPAVLLASHNADVTGEDGITRLGRIADLKDDRCTGPLEGHPFEFAPGFVQMFRASLRNYDHLWSGMSCASVEGEPVAHDNWYVFLAGSLGSSWYLAASLARYRQHGRNTFGWRKLRPSWLTRVSREVTEATSTLRRRRIAAEQRAGVLEVIARSVDEPLAPQAAQAAEAYRQLSKALSIREQLHTGATMADRIQAHRELQQRRAYGASPWQFGRMAHLMDLSTGLSGLTQRWAAP